MAEVSKFIADKIDGLRSAGQAYEALVAQRAKAARELVVLEAKVKKSLAEVQGRTEDLAKAVIE